MQKLKFCKWYPVSEPVPQTNFAFHTLVRVAGWHRFGFGSIDRNTMTFSLCGDPAIASVKANPITHWLALPDGGYLANLKLEQTNAKTQKRDALGRFCK